MSAIEQQKSRTTSTDNDKSDGSPIRRQSTFLHFFRQPNVSHSVPMGLRHHHLRRKHIRSTPIRDWLLPDQYSDHWDEIEWIPNRTRRAISSLRSQSIDSEWKCFSRWLHLFVKDKIMQRRILKRWPSLASVKRSSSQVRTELTTNDYLLALDWIESRWPKVFSLSLSLLCHWFTFISFQIHLWTFLFLEQIIWINDRFFIVLIEVIRLQNDKLFDLRRLIYEEVLFDLIIKTITNCPKRPSDESNSPQIHSTTLLFFPVRWTLLPLIDRLQLSWWSVVQHTRHPLGNIDQFSQYFRQDHHRSVMKNAVVNTGEVNQILPCDLGGASTTTDSVEFLSRKKKTLIRSISLSPIHWTKTLYLRLWVKTPDAMNRRKCNWSHPIDLFIRRKKQNKSFAWAKEVWEQLSLVYWRIPESEWFHFGIVHSCFISHEIMRHSFQLTSSNAHIHFIREKCSRCKEKLFHVIIMHIVKKKFTQRTISNHWNTFLLIARLLMWFFQLCCSIDHDQPSHWRKWLCQAQEKWMFEGSFIK